MIYLIFTLFLSLSISQEIWYNYPELEWKTFETDNFIICFHEETKRSAGEVAKVAEEVHESITSLYDFIMQ